MSQTSRELVWSTLRFQSPSRLPRQVWTLPWATERYPEVMRLLAERWPDDFAYPVDISLPSRKRKGHFYDAGPYVDEWGCMFTNIERGVIGEAKVPLVPDLSDWRRVEPPEETLPIGLAAAEARDRVNRSCAESDLFLLCHALPRPWERYQWIRTTEEAMMDVMDPGPEVRGLLRKIHEFYLREFEFWASTDVDGMFFMDDWGTQNQLLVPPVVWRDLFKPMYKDYCDIAKAHGKTALMHSDGYTLEIYPDIVEIGVDAFNSQVFCMGLENVAAIAKGKITFWGEIDRQWIMSSPDPEAGRKAVREYARHLYDPRGGVIIEFEFGAGSTPVQPPAIMSEWEAVQREAGKCLDSAGVQAGRGGFTPREQRGMAKA